MKALDALHKRSSMPRLTGPAPDAAALDNMFRAALRAADHKLLRPWRFLLIQGDSLGKLGELFAQALLTDNPDATAEEIERIRQKPLRAPMIVVSIASPRAHPKVPELEQDLSAGAATQNLLNAAFAQELGAMWRTGTMAYHDVVKQGLGLTAEEKIIGFLYLGTAAAPCKRLPEEDPSQYVKEW